MFFTIHSSNGLAIYDQIVRQIKFAIADEALRPGDFVPSVRELAQSLVVNPNTVARAYRELQGEGILLSIRGTGLEVSPQAAKACRQERVKLLRERIRNVLLEASQSQLPTSEIRELVNHELARLEQGTSP